MIHTATGRVKPIYVGQGKFLFNIWSESKDNNEDASEEDRRRSVEGRNTFAALAGEDEKPTAGFNWRGEIF